MQSPHFGTSSLLLPVPLPTFSFTWPDPAPEPGVRLYLTTSNQVYMVLREYLESKDLNSGMATFLLEVVHHHVGYVGVGALGSHWRTDGVARGRGLGRFKTGFGPDESVLST